ncbi:MAG TPA: MBL fold metallo-hydrolase [Thermoanaerobaculia bacterium]|nr:MBL fold metallo-hydrolase [Thermoanaerobaculia bacterium]
MKPLFHPRLVNGPTGDPALYIEFLYDRRALLFDLGDVSSLQPRQILKVDHAFVSHTHMDHFFGFDTLLRLFLGRDKILHLYGPPGFLDQVESKLGGYTWNLVESYVSDFVVRALEVHPDGTRTAADFPTRQAFRRHPIEPQALPEDVLHDEETFRVRFVFLDHQIPCLAFALEEKLHVNVWKSGLEELGLPTGPWLRDLKSAVARGEPPDTPVRLGERILTLGLLQEKVLRIVPGQKIAYVTDAGYTPENALAILGLARDADLLFIEAAFAGEDAERAAAKYHLTAPQAGLLARQAGARRLVPFHFSPKYNDGGEQLLQEALEAFRQSD